MLGVDVSGESVDTMASEPFPHRGYGLGGKTLALPAKSYDPGHIGLIANYGRLHEPDRGPGRDESKNPVVPDLVAI